MRALLLVAALLLAGCASPASTPCEPTLHDEGATPVCLVAEGWILQGVAWNANATGAPVALLVHGLNEDHHGYDALAKDLAQRGWKVVAFDSRGHGASTHRADGSERALAQFGPADFPAMTGDARAFLADTHADLVVGASVGSSEALVAAAEAKRHVAVVLLSPGTDYRGIDARTPDQAHDGAILFVASEGDAYAAQSARWMTDHHAEPKTLTLLPGALHGTQILGNATALAGIEDWISAAPHG